MSEILDAALKYLERGMSILPAHPETKHPLVNWKEFHSRRATPDEVRSWFARMPDAMVGIVTGEISGITVIDGDNENAIKTIDGFLGDTITPTVETPRGQHYYFKYRKDVHNSTSKNNSGIDVRSDGGYVAAPPSKRLDGKKYSWVFGIDEVVLSEIPDKLIVLIKEDSRKQFPTNRNVPNQENIPKQESGFVPTFEEGGRDETVFHLCWRLAKSGAPEEEIFAFAMQAAQSCNPPFPESEVRAKVKSALSRKHDSGRSWQSELEAVINEIEGEFELERLYREISAKTPQDKAQVRATIKRFRERGIIEPKGDRDGSYRKKVQDWKPMHYQDAPTKEFPLIIPLGISDLCKVYPGNIIMVAGAKSSGKTAFLLNIIFSNQQRFGLKKEDIIYLNSEMGETELRLRLELFKEININSWNFIPIERYQNWSDLVTGEKKIFIIDYLEIEDNFYLVAKEINRIHHKLKDGIAIVAIQKDTKNPLGRGGSFSLEKPRIYLSMDFGKITIVDAKAWRDPLRNPRGLLRRFRLAGGSYFMPRGDWRTREQDEAEGEPEEDWHEK